MHRYRYATSPGPPKRNDILASLGGRMVRVWVMRAARPTDGTPPGARRGTDACI